MINSTKLKPAQVIVLGFSFIIFIGTIILASTFVTKNHSSIGIINAMFQTTSAVCVTGLSVIDLTKFNIFGQITMLLLIQIGGLGFMSLNTLIILFIGGKISLKNRMIIQESLNFDNLKDVVKWTKRIIFMTFFIELIGAFLLSFQFIKEFGIKKGIYFSIFHSISAFCNAGFDILGNGNSLTNYSGNFIINFTIIFLIICGSIGFITIFEIINIKNYKLFSVHSKLVINTTIFLLLFGFFSYLIFEWNNILLDKPFYEKILISLFSSVTARTAGFAVLDYSQLTNASGFITLILMFIGGASGSVAGGIKVNTVAVIFIAVKSVILGKNDVEIYNRRITNSTIIKALSILSVSMFFNLIIILFILISENTKLMATFFEVVSALATVGLSMNLTSSLCVFSKLVIIFSMFIGRIGAITLLIAISKKKNDINVKYPPANIMVG